MVSRQLGLQFWREVQAGNRNLWVISIEMVHKATRLDDGVNRTREWTTARCNIKKLGRRERTHIGE